MKNYVFYKSFTAKNGVKFDVWTQEYPYGVCDVLCRAPEGFEFPDQVCRDLTVIWDNAGPRIARKAARMNPEGVASVGADFASFELSAQVLAPESWYQHIRRAVMAHC